VKSPTSCAFLLTFTMTISYTIDEEESDLAMRLALRQKANGFYMLPGTFPVPGSAVEVFLCSKTRRWVLGAIHSAVDRTCAGGERGGKWETREHPPLAGSEEEQSRRVRMRGREQGI